MSDLLDASITFCLILMYLMTWWYSDSSGSWTIEVSLLQRSVAFCSSKCASKYWRSWLSDSFGVLSSTFLRVRLGIMALITLLTISNSSYPASCASSIWCMRLTYVNLSFWFASRIWPLIFISYINKVVLQFSSRRMSKTLLPWPSLSALLLAPTALFFPSLSDQLMLFHDPHCRL